MADFVPKIIYNGVTTPIPATTVFDPTLNTQVKSAERNANGKTVREVLPNKWSINAEWKISNQDDLAALFNLLRSLTGVYFNLEFATPGKTIETIEVYISPLSAKMLNFQGTYGTWDTLKCKFVEV